MNYIAGLNETGYGVVARNLFRELTKIQPVKLLPIGRISLDVTAGDDIEIVKKSLSLKEPEGTPSLKVWHHFNDFDNWPATGPRHLYTFFENINFSNTEIDYLNSLDSIFVASKWAKNVLQTSNKFAHPGYSEVKCPIHVVNPGVNKDIFHKDVKPMPLNIGPNTFVVANCGKWEIRKGHDVLLEIFHKAFSRNDDVILIMNCQNHLNIPGQFNGPAVSEEWANYYEQSDMGKAGKIFVNRQSFRSQQQLAQFFAAAHVGLFPIRAEGWNLEAVEMLSMGKSIITTAYSAALEYYKWPGVYSVPTMRQEIPYDPPFFNGTGIWASFTNEEINMFASHLRLCYDKYRAGQLEPIDCPVPEWSDTARQIWDAITHDVPKV